MIIPIQDYSDTEIYHDQLSVFLLQSTIMSHDVPSIAATTSR